MKISGFVFAVGVILGISCVSANENLHIDAIRKGDEDIVTLTDEEGNLVSTTAVHAVGDYQLQKPNDENICLVSRILEEGSVQDFCYERVPLPEDLEHNLELEECEDREVFLLKPVEPKDCENDALISRRGNGVCIWIHIQQCYCAQYQHYGWGRRCIRYASRSVKIRTCF